MGNPITLFNEWLAEAKGCADIREPTAMTLATADSGGRPSVRIVLLKDAGERGFVFYTNLESQKSLEIMENARVAMCFYWMPLDRQVRIEGSVESVEDAEADAYFATRVREKQIGAWASQQSRPLVDRAELEARIAQYEQEFAGKPVSRPPHWSGWRVVPERLEFWQQGEFRLHQRDVYTRSFDGSWEQQLLYP